MEAHNGLSAAIVQEAGFKGSIYYIVKLFDFLQIIKGFGVLVYRFLLSLELETQMKHLGLKFWIHWNLWLIKQLFQYF